MTEMDTASKGDTLEFEKNEPQEDTALKIEFQDKEYCTMSDSSFFSTRHLTPKEI